MENGERGSNLIPKEVERKSAMEKRAGKREMGRPREKGSEIDGAKVHLSENVILCFLIERICVETCGAENGEKDQG